MFCFEKWIFLYHPECTGPEYNGKKEDSRENYKINFILLN